jgi:hypothetical protein
MATFLLLDAKKVYSNSGDSAIGKIDILILDGNRKFWFISEMISVPFDISAECSADSGIHNEKTIIGLELKSSIAGQMLGDFLGSEKAYIVHHGQEDEIRAIEEALGIEGVCKTINTKKVFNSFHPQSKRNDIQYARFFLGLHKKELTAFSAYGSEANYDEYNNLVTLKSLMSYFISEKKMSLASITEDGEWAEQEAA